MSIDDCLTLYRATVLSSTNQLVDLSVEHTDRIVAVSRSGFSTLHDSLDGVRDAVDAAMTEVASREIGHLDAQHTSFEQLHVNQTMILSRLDRLEKHIVQKAPASSQSPWKWVSRLVVQPRPQVLPLLSSGVGSSSLLASHELSLGPLRMLFRRSRKPLQRRIGIKQSSSWYRLRVIGQLPQYISTMAFELAFTFAEMPFGLPSLTFQPQVLRTVSNNAPIIKACEDYDLERIRSLFETGQASPFDRCEGGCSLVNVVIGSLLKGIGIDYTSSDMRDSLSASREVLEILEFLFGSGLTCDELTCDLHSAHPRYDSTAG